MTGYDSAIARSVAARTVGRLWKAVAIRDSDACTVIASTSAALSAAMRQSDAKDERRRPAPKQEERRAASRLRQGVSISAGVRGRSARRQGQRALYAAAWRVMIQSRSDRPAAVAQQVAVPQRALPAPEA